MRGRLGLPLLGYALLILAWIYQTRIYIPQLPETVVSHFDFSGRPDGSMSREGFRMMSLLAQGGCAGFFLLLAFLLPRIPLSLISLPHAEIWLTGDRREASLAFLTRSLLWMGALSLGMTLMVFQATIRANLGRPVLLGRSIWIALGAYLGSMALLIRDLFDRFGLPDESMDS